MWKCGNDDGTEEFIVFLFVKKNVERKTIVST